MDQPEATTAEVKAAFTEFFQAWNEHDFEGATAPFASNATLFDTNPPHRFHGIEKISAWARGILESASDFHITTDEVQIETKGPVAWVTAHWVSTRNEGLFSMVWVREQSGEYSLRLFHISPLPKGSSN